MESHHLWKEICPIGMELSSIHGTLGITPLVKDPSPWHYYDFQEPITTVRDSYGTGDVTQIFTVIVDNPPEINSQYQTNLLPVNLCSIVC